MEAFSAKLPSFNDKDLDIQSLGAVGDGSFDNTEVLQGAIDSCSELGGRVIVPRGIYYTRPLELKSNVRLHLSDGAVLLFSNKKEDYKLINTNFEGFFTYRCISPIYGKEIENAAVTGSGVIDGNGGAWRPVKKFKTTEKMWNALISSGGIVQNAKEDVWWPSQQALDGNNRLVPQPELLKNKEECEKYKHFLRPALLNLTNCKNILLEGVTFQNSPAWCLHLWLCRDVTVKNISVRNPWYSQNGDGIDIDSCRYVEVRDSVFDVGDDAICIKSGKNEDGRRLGRCCQDILIDNCSVYHGHGGFVVGSEMSGSAKDIKVTNCTFMGTDVGLRFKSCLGRGGVVENIYIDNIYMTDIANEAIVFNMGYDMDTKAGQEIKPEEIPEFKNISISNIYCTQAGRGIAISGLDAMPVHDISLTNIRTNAKNPDKIEKAVNIVKKDIE